MNTMIHDNVLTAEYVTLGDGVRFERRLFHSLFGAVHQQDGMAAFFDKRQPAFSHC